MAVYTRNRYAILFYTLLELLGFRGGLVEALLAVSLIAAVSAIATGRSRRLVLVFALRGRAVGSEQIYAALSAYLLAGFFFGLLYWVIEYFFPGSITVGGAVVQGGTPWEIGVRPGFFGACPACPGERVSPDEVLCRP